MARILITGGTRGIGLAAAETLAGLGHQVAIVGVDEQRATSVAERMRADGSNIEGYGCDVADPDAVAKLAQRVGPIDVLILSAGVMSERMSKTLRTSPEEWRRVMGINLDGVMWPITQFVPGMVERRSLFAALDRDGDGALDFRELLVGMLIIHGHVRFFAVTPAVLLLLLASPRLASPPLASPRLSRARRASTA